MTRAAVRKHPNAINPDYLVSLEQQAGAGLVGGRRPVRLRPGPPRAADRAPREARRIARAARSASTQLVQAMEEPATAGHPRGSSCADPAQGARHADGPDAARGAGAADALGGRGAHRRDLNSDGAYDDDARRHADGRVVAEARRRASSSRAGRRRFTRCERCSAPATSAAARPDAPDFFDGWWGYVCKDLRALIFDRRRTRRQRAAGQRYSRSTAAAAR